MSMHPALLVPEYQNEGVAYVFETQCGTRRSGYYTAFMVYVGGTPRPHTGPLATREEADRLVEKLNLAAEYVDLIGYDPFEDDPSETVESVRQRLVEYKKAVAEDAEGAA